MDRSESCHLKGADVLVIPGVDAYLGALGAELGRGALDPPMYESVRVCTSTYKSEGEQLTFPPTDKDHGECESRTPSALSGRPEHDTDTP